MNCKPGDLAVIIHGGPIHTGRLVEVLRAEPVGEYTLPDGYPALGFGGNPAWIVKSLGAPFLAPLARGTRRTKYGALCDWRLRPIRPGDGEDEMLRIAGKPEARQVFEFSEEQA